MSVDPGVLIPSSQVLCRPRMDGQDVRPIPPVHLLPKGAVVTIDALKCPALGGMKKKEGCVAQRPFNQNIRAVPAYIVMSNHFFLVVELLNSRVLFPDNSEGIGRVSQRRLGLIRRKRQAGLRIDVVFTLVIIHRQGKAEFAQFENLIRGVGKLTIPQQRPAISGAVLHGETETADSLVVPGATIVVDRECCAVEVDPADISGSSCELPLPPSFQDKV